MVTLLQNLPDEVVLAPLKVTIKRHPGNTGIVDDPVNTDGMEAMLREEFGGFVYHLLTLACTHQ